MIAMSLIIRVFADFNKLVELPRHLPLDVSEVPARFAVRAMGWLGRCAF